MADSRPYQTREGLPSGWLAQWEPTYNTYFYVNENSADKSPTWTHPTAGASPPPPPPGASLKAPEGAPPSYDAVASSAQPQQLHQQAQTQARTEYGPGQSASKPWGDATYQPAQPAPMGYGGYPPQGAMPYGGGGYPQQQYAQPYPQAGPGYGHPQQQYMQQPMQQPNNRRMGGGMMGGGMMMPMMLGMGGGLLAGGLIGSSLAHDGYGDQQAYQDGKN